MTMLRLIQKSDIDALLKIENAVHLAPWSRETFETCFKAACKGWVMEQDKQIVGFVIVSLHPHECHILNVCVAREAQRQGFAQQLIECALHEAKQAGIEIAYLEVRRSNDKAIALYRKMKFLNVGERKNYYPSGLGREDALIFAKSL